MKCDLCGRREAVAYVKRVPSGADAEVRLCAECAAARKAALADVEGSLSYLVGGTAGSRTRSGGSARQDKAPKDRTCPRCGSSLAEMLKNRAAGCSACWRAFPAEFGASRGEVPAEITDRIWTGRLPGRLAAARAALVELADTRLALQTALRAEDYETAARCRDRLLELEAETGHA